MALVLFLGPLKGAFCKLDARGCEEHMNRRHGHPAPLPFPHGPHPNAPTSFWTHGSGDPRAQSVRDSSGMCRGSAVQHLVGPCAKEWEGHWGFLCFLCPALSLTLCVCACILPVCPRQLYSAPVTSDRCRLMLLLHCVCASALLPSAWAAASRSLGGWAMFAVWYFWRHAFGCVVRTADAGGVVVSLLVV